MALPAQAARDIDPVWLVLTKQTMRDKDISDRLIRWRYFKRKSVIPFPVKNVSALPERRDPVIQRFPKRARQIP